MKGQYDKRKLIYYQNNSNWHVKNFCIFVDTALIPENGIFVLTFQKFPYLTPNFSVKLKNQ